MAELTGPISSCCAPEAQDTCCEPSEKDVCCVACATGETCGCAAGSDEPAAESDIRETVRERYTVAARAAAQGQPLPDAPVDVVISNCVINLAADKRRVIVEAARVLRPGGRFAVSDVIADGGMDDATQADTQQWTGCVAGALPETEFRSALTDAGLVDIEVRITHAVHENADAAVVRARKPRR
jgi:SAM-dependent methyltransferase